MSLLGVKGYVLKTQAAEDLFCTLDAVAVNEQYFSEEVNEKLHLASASNLHRRIASLKERERTFLKYLCTGMTYKEVAAAMNISPYTVEDYRDTLFKKFEIKSKTELVLFALKYKIVEQKR
ncbi:MAG TPA: response regulator transcription factor [Agriterribacter sp.]|nr:response regulator transcription factor [Agriterribacter sp.]